MPEAWRYGLQRRFHNGSAGTFVATPSLAAELKARGFERLMLWSRGVDTELFRPRNVRLFGDGPVFLYVGRIAVEKNIKAFLDLDLPGRKVLVGGGPQAAELQRLYPDALFAGPREGEALAQAYASADVFVFPSLTDTFGLVLLEALASGVPVAAFPAAGPIDVHHRSAGRGAECRFERGGARARSQLDRGAARAHALRYSWENSARQFIENMLAAHNLGLPAQAGPPLARRKRKRPGWGEPGRLILMRQFGGRFGGTRVHPKMVSGLKSFKRATRKSSALSSKYLTFIGKKTLAEQRRALDGVELGERQRLGRLERPAVPPAGRGARAGSGLLALAQRRRGGGGCGLRPRTRAPSSCGRHRLASGRRLACGPCRDGRRPAPCSANAFIFEAMSSTLKAMSSTPQISIMALIRCSMKRSALTTFSVRCPVMSWNEQAV